MIGRRERRLRGVFSLKHSGRMCHANQKHCLFAGFGYGFVHGAPGMLFEHVVDVLQTRNIALTNAVYSLVKPADCRAEGDAVMPNFPFGF